MTHHVSGFAEVQKLLADLDSQGRRPIFVLFCGSKDAQGNSWCPDCVKAEPIVAAAAEAKLGDGVLVHCDVGARDYWKDPSNAFRTTDNFKVTGVPTLLKWKTQERLVEEQCANQPLVEMLFEN